MPDSPLITADSPKEAPTTAFLEFAREHDRLITFHLYIIYSALAIGKIGLESIGLDDSTKAGFAEIRKRLNPAGTRDPYPDEVIYHFHDSLLAEMLVARHVDNFLAYVVQLLTLVFAARPELLRSQEQVRLDFVLSHPDKDSLVRALIERRVDRLAYLGIRDLDKDIQDRLGFSLFATPEDLETAVTLIETRNVIVHNRGIVSKVAANRCPTLAPELGMRVSLTTDKVVKHRPFFGKLVLEIDARAVKKFGIRPAGLLRAQESIEPTKQPQQPSSAAGAPTDSTGA